MSSTSFDRSLGGIDDSVQAFANGFPADMTAGKNVVTVASAGEQGVRLPAGFGVGEIVYVANNTAVAVFLSPAEGKSIGGATADDTVEIPANSMAVCMSLGDGNWSVTV